MKKLIKHLLQYSFTDTEALLLCIYQLAVFIVMCMAIIKFQIVTYYFEWMFDGLISNNTIIMANINVFINILFLIQIIENIKEVVVAFLCNCDDPCNPVFEE